MLHRHGVVCCLFFLGLCASPALAGTRKSHGVPASIILNGKKTSVVWTDGDSFKVESGPHSGAGSRLMGFNTLEAYGPVHRWGTWTAAELFALAKSSSTVAASQEWTCTTNGELDGYKRLLVNCPDLAVEMVKAGHALAYVVDQETAAPGVLAAQAQAMKDKRGMWAKGAVKGVVTSVHSVGEDGGHGATAYNRVVDTRTGKAAMVEHAKTYQSCQEVCVDVEGETSCLVYVPFNTRYKNQPACLK